MKKHQNVDYDFKYDLVLPIKSLSILCLFLVREI